jgi:hypothetical protein
MRRSRTASAAAVAALALAGCGDDERRSDPEQVTAVATEYAHAFGKGDGEAACSRLNEAAQEEFTKRVSTLVGTRDCAEAVEKLQAAAGPNVTGPFQEAKASDPQIEGDTATVKLMAGTGTEEVKLEKVDGEWLLTHAPGT